MSPAAERQHAHELIDKMEPTQLTAIVNLLEVMIDPVSRAIRNVPIDDEPVGKHIGSPPKAECASHEDFLAELGATMTPLQRSLAEAPLDDEPSDPVERTSGALISNREVLAEFGLTEEDFLKMGQQSHN